MATSTITKKKPDHGMAIGLLEIPKEVLNNMRSITENLPKRSCVGCLRTFQPYTLDQDRCFRCRRTLTELEEWGRIEPRKEISVSVEVNVKTHREGF
jgi:predicted Fe-S protein YdhL (DUF1289 family)